MPYKTQNPHTGYGGTVTSFNETSWPNDRNQLGYVHEQGLKRWQAFKIVDTTASAGDLLYIKNYASYEATPTIGNSSLGEVAGVAEGSLVANSYAWLRQGGPIAIKANGVFLRGMPVWADISTNRAIPGGVFSGSLTAVTDTTVGGVFQVANPSAGAWRVTSLVVSRSTKSSGASALDAGVAVDATTGSDNLIDGLAMGAAEANNENNFANAGTNGKASAVGAAGSYLNGTASATAAGLVGTYSGTFELVGAGGVARPQVIGRALGALGADVQGVVTSGTQVAVDLDIKPL